MVQPHSTERCPAQAALEAVYDTIESTFEPVHLAQGQDRRLALDRLCRETTRLSQIGEEVVQPKSLNYAPAAAVDAAVIQWDLVRVLVLEVLETDAGSWLQSGLTTALREAVERRREAECGPAGLIRAAVSAGCQADRLADAIMEHAEALNDRYRQDGWYPLQPQGLETLRSVSPISTPIARRCDIAPP